MKLRYITYAAAVIAGFFGEAAAVAPADYADRFKIDLHEKLPPIEELREQFRPAPVYDRKFKYYWAIGNKFDKSFATTIREYGTRDKRLKWQGEDEFYEMVKSMPPQMYEYIGPYLHTVPGIPEKVLNMPGIKETKNRFPSRIAPQVADIENIEMLSPVLYFLLMPEAWPENYATDELEIPAKLPEPANKYNPKLFDDIAKIVRPQDYAPGATVKSPVAGRLRTIRPDADSPLTTPDIQAFAATLSELKTFGEDVFMQLQIVEAGHLLDSWEDANGKGTGLPNLKDLVLPCARLVQKLRLSGLDTEFKTVIAKQGFNDEEWAYTCDKTVKAYRLLNMSQVELQTLMLYRKNIYGDMLGGYSYKYAPLVAATMQSMVERYDAPLNDMLEVKKNYKQIEDALRDSGGRIAGQTIYMK